MTDSEDLASKYFEASYLVISQKQPTYRLMSSGVVPPVKFAQQTVEVKLSDWAFDTGRVLDPEKSCPKKLSLEFDTVTVKVGQDARLNIGGFQYSPTDTRLISDTSQIECNRNFTYEVLLNGAQDLGYFIRLDKEQLWILPHAASEKGVYELQVTARE